MKKYAMLALVSVFVFSMSALAQDQTPPPRSHKGHAKEFRQEMGPKVDAQKRAERMSKQLGLSDSEKSKVQALFEKQDAKREKHQAEVQKMREEQKAQFEKDRRSQDVELERIIGKEKFQKHEAIRSEHQQNMKQRRNGVKPNDGKGRRGRQHKHDQKMSTESTKM